MDANLEKKNHIMIKNTVSNLEKNGMKAVYVPTKEAALSLLKTLLVPGETIAVGGSVTLNETGALALIKSGKYNFIDRYDKNATREEINERLRQGLLADTFVMSSNAITETGYLYNVDGTSNRVSALMFGPKRVIILAGYNKIVPNITDAVTRVKNIAAPANAIRLDRDTFCAKHGKCIVNSCDPKFMMTIPALSCKNSICCNSVVTGIQRDKNRITVIIIGEQLGY